MSGAARAAVLGAKCPGPGGESVDSSVLSRPLPRTRPPPPIHTPAHAHAPPAKRRSTRRLSFQRVMPAAVWASNRASRTSSRSSTAANTSGDTWGQRRGASRCGLPVRTSPSKAGGAGCPAAAVAWPRIGPCPGVARAPGRRPARLVRGPHAHGAPYYVAAHEGGDEGRQAGPVEVHHGGVAQGQRHPQLVLALGCGIGRIGGVRWAR